ncbi:hypothetical protein ACTFIR_007013 [Dictyostelium discoideum]
MIPTQTPPRQQMMNHNHQPQQIQPQQIQPHQPHQPQQQQPHQFRPLDENAEIPFLQIVTPNQMIKLPPMFQEQYKQLLNRWSNQCIKKSGLLYTQAVPYNQVLVLLEIAKNGDIQEYRDFIQVIIESSQNKDGDENEESIQQQQLTLKSIINLIDLEGNTSIHYAIMRKNKAMVSYLIDCGANLDIQNLEEGHTPLHWACIKADSSFVLQLVENGADIHLTDKRGYNALLHAAQYNEVNSVRYLIEKGLDPVQCKDIQLHTAVHWTSFQGHANMARYFISLGVDANAQDIQGRTAFHWGCIKGHKQVVSMLCSFEGQDSIDKTIRDNDGKTAYQLAESKEHYEIIDYLDTKLKDDKLFGGNERLYHRFWTVMGVLTVLVPTWILCYVPVIFGLPLLAVGGYFLKNYLHLNYWVPERNNWLLPSILYSSVSIWYLIYLLRIAPLVMAINIFPNLIINATSWYFFYFFIRLTKEDPGTISKHISKEKSNENFMNALSSGRQIPLICPTCLINRPIRSKHCPSCKGCFARFDHHCVWINKCIGINNQALFITVLFSYVILVISGFIVTWDYFKSDLNAPILSESYAQSFLFYYTNYPFILLFSIYGIGMAFWIGKLAISQVLTILFNKTTYEQIQQIREFESRQGHGHSHGGDQQCNHSHGGSGGDHGHSHGGSSGGGSGSGSGDHGHSHGGQPSLPSSSGASKKDSDKSFHNQQTNFDMYHRGVVNNVKEFLFDSQKFYFQTENIYADSRV